jgi:hypothetical protein
MSTHGVAFEKGPLAVGCPTGPAVAGGRGFELGNFRGRRSIGCGWFDDFELGCHGAIPPSGVKWAKSLNQIGVKKQDFLKTPQLMHNSGGEQAFEGSSS